MKLKNAILLLLFLFSHLHAGVPEPDLANTADVALAEANAAADATAKADAAQAAAEATAAADATAKAAAAQAASVSNGVQYLERFMRHPNATISSSSVANPTVITTAAAHGLTTGDLVGINGHTGSTPAVAGQYTVTVISPTTFSVPVNVTVGGTGGVVGKCIAATDLPEIGGTAWRMSRNATGSSFSAENPHLTPHGMRAPRETLIYMGAQHTEPVTSMTLLMSFRASLTPLAVARNGVTISTSASPLLYAGGPSGIILPQRMLHMTILSTGEPSVGLGTGVGGAVWTDPTSKRVRYAGLNNSSAPQGFQLGADSIIRIEMETGEMRVFLPGAVWTYNDSRFNSDLIGPHWWIEMAGDRYNGVDYRDVPYFRAIWLNSPKLDMLPGWGAQPYSDMLSRLASDGTVPIANPLTLSGAVSHTAGYSSTTANGIKGTPYAGWGTRSPVYALESKTSADISSTAGMVYTSGSLISMAARDLVAGAVNTYELSGFFADTANDRRLVANEASSGDLFDSGVLAAADVRNKSWTLKITVQRTGSHAKRWVSEFTVSGRETIIQHDTTTNASALAINLRCDSVSANDVQVLTYFSTSPWVP